MLPLVLAAFFQTSVEMSASPMEWGLSVPGKNPNTVVLTAALSWCLLKS